ncbi:type III CRISPR-associated RAMP protein Csx7 [Caloranaerobacter sp. DY30410]|uniref:type III CRISPR-associated RAMP protein Csx7 n=1 Tax=Caloranaerobacter sp. DY30410 TaxID=3238305 RepID=UPI003D076182
MFSKLYNEAIIEFELETVSPLFIKSSEEDQLNPTSAENTYLAFYKDGKRVPVIPGTSLKGVFRSRAEEKLTSTCNLFNGDNCGSKIREKEKELEKRLNGQERYEESCLACKIFGSTALKSRVQFSDAYPISSFRIGKRSAVAIDRITGASKRGALFDFEYVEYCKFKANIKFKNFYKWHIKLIIDIFEDINDGLVTFGGLTSKGFGVMKADNVNLLVRYYDKSKKNEDYQEDGLYIYKKIEGLERIADLFKNVDYGDEGRDISNEQAI